jgi:hypothetical protein
MPIVDIQEKQNEEFPKSNQLRKLWTFTYQKLYKEFQTAMVLFGYYLEVVDQVKHH